MLPVASGRYFGKPRLGHLGEAALRLGQVYDAQYPPQLALFVGDRQEDKHCAENAGIDFVDAKEWRREGGRLEPA